MTWATSLKREHFFSLSWQGAPSPLLTSPSQDSFNPQFRHFWLTSPPLFTLCSSKCSSHSCQWPWHKIPSRPGAAANVRIYFMILLKSGRIRTSGCTCAPGPMGWTGQSKPTGEKCFFYDILTFPRSTVQARAILQHCSPSSFPSLSSTIFWKLLHRLPTIFLSASEFWSAWLAPIWALYVQQRSIIYELFLKFISFAILPFCRKPGEMDGWLLLSGLSTLLQQLHPQVSSSFIFGCFSPRWENNWWRSSSKLATHSPLHQITKRSKTLLLTVSIKHNHRLITWDSLCNSCRFQPMESRNKQEFRKCLPFVGFWGWKALVYRCTSTRVKVSLFKSGLKVF